MSTALVPSAAYRGDSFADPSDLEILYGESSRRVSHYRTTARDSLAYKDRANATAYAGPYGSSVGGYGSSAGYANTGEGMFAAAVANLGGLFAGYDDIAHAMRQYAAFRDIPFTAIRPITVKIADQPIHIGRKSTAPSAARDGLLTKGDQHSLSVIKELAAAGIDTGSENFLKLFEKIQHQSTAAEQERLFHFRRIIDAAPSFIRKAARGGSSGNNVADGNAGTSAGGIEIIPHHPIIDAIENPNDFFTQWALIWCTITSIIVTGRSFWWIDEESDTNPAGGEGGKRITIWYIPSSWVRPVHTRERAFDSWIVRPVNTAAWMPVARENMIPFYVWNPANPTTMFSPLQSQSYAISTDEEIQKAQYHSMKNVQKPGMILRAGRMQLPPGMSGQGPRPVLSPEQRTQLIQAVRLAYRGAMHMNEPIIVDGLIEDAEPYMANPVDLDFLNGSKLTRMRIMQGFGVNPIIAGEIEGANRASAYVATEHFYENVVNPYITFFSQMLTKYLAPRFAGKGEKLYLWLERAKAHDEDLTMSKLKLCADNEALEKNELRKFADLAPRPDCEVLVPPKGKGAGMAGAGGERGEPGTGGTESGNGKTSDGQPTGKTSPSPAGETRPASRRSAGRRRAASSNENASAQFVETPGRRPAKKRRPNARQQSAGSSP